MQFTGQLAPKSDDSIVVEAEVEPSSSDEPTLSEYIESSHAEQGVGKPQSPSSNVVVPHGLQCLPLVLPKCARDSPAGAEKVEPGPTLTSGSSEDHLSNPSTPVQESSSTQPTPIDVSLT